MSNFNFPPASEVFTEHDDLHGLYVQHINDEISEALTRSPAMLGAYSVHIQRLSADKGFPRSPDFKSVLAEAVKALNGLGYVASFTLDGRSGAATFVIQNQTKEQRAAAVYAERALANKQAVR